MKNKDTGSTGELILVLYPNAYGMGYLLCESPKEIVNYGVARIRPLFNDNYINRLHQYIHYYKPNLIILRNVEGSNTISKRIKSVVKDFVEHAEAENLPVFQYSRQQIKDIFGEFGGTKKYAIARQLTKWYPELLHRMPAFRNNCHAEHYQMGVFDAFSLMLTHYYLID